MKITVKLFATLRENREKIIQLDVEKETKPYDIAQILNIPLQEIAILMINGRSADMDRKLADNDVLAFFPPVGGG